MNSKIAKNYLFSLFTQIFVLITPFITTPYVSRILLPAGVGQYSYTYAIVSIFVLFGSFGFNYYAQKEISKYQENPNQQFKVFWEVFICKIITSIFCLIAYVIFICFINDKVYLNLLLIWSFNILAITIDCTFFFQGNENFKIIAIINTVVKTISVISVFLFIKKVTDVWEFVLINSLSLFINHLILWFFMPKKIFKIQFNCLDIKRHFIPSFKFFIPTIAMSIYTILDKTLIGLIVPKIIEINGEIIYLSNIENGLYEQSEKVVKMTLTILTSLGTVMIPTNSHFFEIGDYQKVKSNVENAFRFCLFLGIPIMFGIIGISNNFSTWFFGDGYEKVPFLIRVFSPLIIFCGLNNILGVQYLIPIGKEKNYTIFIFVGAGVNFTLNLILIPFYYSLGASIASVIAELVILLTEMIYLRKELSFKVFLLDFIKYIICGSIMLFILLILDHYLCSSIINTILLVFVGIVVYTGMLILFKDKTIMFVLKKIKELLKKGRKKYVK